jgi:hypothetical protein
MFISYPYRNSFSFADRDMFCRFAGIGVGHQVQYDSLNVIQHDHAVASRSPDVSHGDTSDDDDLEANANVDSGDENWQEDGCGRDLDDNVDKDKDNMDEHEYISKDCDSDVEDSDDHGSDSEDEGPAFKF